MAKFDLSLKINPVKLIRLLFEPELFFPDQLLKQKFNFSSLYKPYYFNWGRSALYYLFRSLPYRKIVFPAFTCPTLTEAAEKANKKVILTEIDLNTFNLDLEKIPRQTECLTAVHTFGNPLDIEKIRKKAGKNIFIVEDCAHALFSRIKGNFCGRKGEAVLFSLYKQVPNLNGALLLTKKRMPLIKRTKTKALISLKRLIIKLDGPHQRLLDWKKKQYLAVIEKQEINNSCPHPLIYRLFNSGFSDLEKEIKKRRKTAVWYYQQINKSPYLIAQQPESRAELSYYQFPVRLKPELSEFREQIVRELRKNNIFIDRLWYQAPIVQKKYRQFWKNCPNALLLARTIVNLPISGSYSQEDVAFLFRRINKVIKKITKQ